eukprot:3219000-Rhodomonas_salina.1
MLSSKTPALAHRWRSTQSVCRRCEEESKRGERTEGVEGSAVLARECVHLLVDALRVRHERLAQHRVVLLRQVRAVHVELGPPLQRLPLPRLLPLHLQFPLRFCLVDPH